MRATTALRPATGTSPVVGQANVGGCFAFFVMFLAIFIFTNCADQNQLKVVEPYPDTANLKSCLEYWTSHFSNHAVNHYFVGKTNVPNGFAEVLIYWKEERQLIEYQNIDSMEPGSEILSFHHSIKLDRDTVDTSEEIAGSTYVITHRNWIELMEQCIKIGKEHLVTIDEAKKFFPNKG